MADSEPGREVARSELRASHEAFWQWVTRQPQPYEIAVR